MLLNYLRTDILCVPATAQNLALFLVHILNVICTFNECLTLFFVFMETSIASGFAPDSCSDIGYDIGPYSGPNYGS